MAFRITNAAPYVNAALSQVLGEEAVANLNMSNIADAGTAIANANLEDPTTKGLMSQVGRMLFVERKYDGIGRNVLRDGSEFGSIVAKFSTPLKEARQDPSWFRTDKQAFPVVFYSTEVNSRIYNSTNPYQFDDSTYYDQLKGAFQSEEQMNRFLSMKVNMIQNSASVALENLIRGTINNFIGETVYSEVTDGTYTGRTGNRAVNVLYMYNQTHTEQLTTENFWLSEDFWRFFIIVLHAVQDKMKGYNKLYNVEGEDRFTPGEMQDTLILSQAADACGVYLYDANGQFRTDNLSLGKIEKIPYWQGLGTSTGTDLGLAENAKISITTTGNNTLEIPGVLALVYDHDALGVFNELRKVTTDYSGDGDFWTSHYKFRAQYFNSFSEQGVVLYVA